jgi:carboxymethylenebutenolidase
MPRVPPLDAYVARPAGAGHSFLDHHELGLIEPVVRAAGVRFHEPSDQDAWTRILRVFDEQLRPTG